jgi:putative acetyltransferase
MHVEIRIAQSATDLEQVRRLYRGFADWQAKTYVDGYFLRPDFFDDLAAEIAALPGNYAPPAGCLLLAWVADLAVGTGAIQDCGNGLSALKGMFVSTDFQGQGIGKLLVERLLAEARSRGYTHINLKTGPRQVAAQKLYIDMGFERVEPSAPALTGAGDGIWHMVRRL